MSPRGDSREVVAIVTFRGVTREMKQLESDAELSDREWRQMRRTLSKLEFEPVPETPPLLPRSAFDDSAKEEGEEANPATRIVANDDLSASNHQESPTSRKSTMDDGPAG